MQKRHDDRKLEKDVLLLRMFREKRTGQCDNPQIGAGELENIVADAIREILGNPENIENIISIIREEKTK